MVIAFEFPCFLLQCCGVSWKPPRGLRRRPGPQQQQQHYQPPALSSERASLDSVVKQGVLSWRLDGHGKKWSAGIVVCRTHHLSVFLDTQALTRNRPELRSTAHTNTG